MGRKSKLREVFIWLTEWVFMWALWMLFISKWDSAEAILGAVVSGVATVATAIVQKDPLVSFFPYWRWLVQGVMIPGYVISGTWEVLKALGLQLFTKKGAPSSLIR